MCCLAEERFRHITFVSADVRHAHFRIRAAVFLEIHLSEKPTEQRADGPIGPRTLGGLFPRASAFKSQQNYAAVLSNKHRRKEKKKKTEKTNIRAVT